jgi:hypothetical protein
MKRTLASVAVIAALSAAVVYAPTAAANSFAISIGLPGFAAGYSSAGGYVAAYPAPPVVYAPAPVYYARPYPYYRPPFAYYGGYRPWSRHYVYRHW